jgi:hypothetical protein
MIKPLCLSSSCRCIRPSLFLQHIMTLKWIKWTSLSFLYGSIDQVVYVELPHSYELSDKVALLNKALYGWSKHLVCGIRLYMIFSCLLVSVDLILTIACLYKMVSSSLSMLMTFCLLKRISQLFRTLNNVLMTCSRCQISVLCLLSRHESEMKLHWMHNLSYSNSLHQQGSSDLSAVADCFCWHFYEFWCSTHEGLSLRLTSLSFDSIRKQSDH